VKLKDVAKLAGVSTATASLALNGKSVNKKTREKVIECAAKLNYVPNKIGRTLITGRSNTIELVILSTAQNLKLVTGTVLYHYILQGVLKITEIHGYSLRFNTKFYEDEALHQYFRLKVMDKSIDGIIVIPQYLQKYDFISLFHKNNFPYVMLCPPSINDGDINCVDMNNYYGGSLVAECFVSRGFKKIAFINGPENHLDAIERERGFIDTLKKHNVYLQEGAKKYGNFTIAQGYERMKEILNATRPEALFCANDYMAAGAIRCIAEKRIRVPEDMSIIGYDNQDLTEALTPPLSSVDNKFELLGEHLASEILKSIEDPSTAIKKQIDPELIMRNSVLS
jgi:DNA-binding LacI/PurR family transcriptional regulator